MARDYIITFRVIEAVREGSRLMRNRRLGASDWGGTREYDRDSSDVARLGREHKAAVSRPNPSGRCKKRPRYFASVRWVSVPHCSRWSDSFALACFRTRYCSAGRWPSAREARNRANQGRRTDKTLLCFSVRLSLFLSNAIGSPRRRAASSIGASTYSATYTSSSSVSLLLGPSAKARPRIQSAMASGYR